MSKLVRNSSIYNTQMRYIASVGSSPDMCIQNIFQKIKKERNLFLILRISICPPVFYRIFALTKIVKLTKKNLRWCSIVEVAGHFAKKRAPSRYFPVNLTKFFRASFLKNTFKSTVSKPSL